MFLALLADILYFQFVFLSLMILPPFLTLLTIPIGFDIEFVAGRGGKRSCFGAALLHKASFHTIITLKEATFFPLLLLFSAAR
jgi:hypothetical protein